jgi:hypothetical protein
MIKLTGSVETYVPAYFHYFQPYIKGGVMKNAASAIRIFLILLFAVPNVFSQTPVFSWTNSAGGLLDDYCYGMTVDATGNTYVTGKFKSTPMSFGSGVEITSIGNFDIFLAKYDPNGQILWAVQAGSAGTSSADEGRGIAVDAGGNVIVTGAFFGTGYFGTDTLFSAGNFDAFIAKYDANGNYQWVVQGSSVNQNKGTGVKVDSDGNYIGIGYFGGTATDTINFNGYLLTGNGNRDAYIVKIDPAGNVLWATNAGGIESGEEAWGIDIDESNNIYVTGYFAGDASFGTFNLTSLGGSDVFTAKLNSAGTYLWVNGMHGPLNDRGYALDYNANQNAVYVTGYFEDTLYVGGTEYITNGLDDIFVGTYAGDGSLLGSGVCGSAADDHAWGIVCRNDGFYYVTGYIDGDLYFGGDTLITNGAQDAVIIAMYQDSLIWMKNYGGLLDEETYGIGLDASEDIYLAGNFKSLEAYYDYDTLFTAGLRDLWVGKIHDDLIPVELATFNGTVTEDAVILNWTTATEVNNAGFEIQKSIDRNNFKNIGFIEGNGTTTEKHNYSFVDKTSTSGVVYYRLKQTDYDGSYAYSETIEIDLSVPGRYDLSQNYPNPFNPGTNINFALPFNSHVEITLFNVLGQEVAKILNADFSAGRYTMEFDGSGFTSGIYFYKINAEGKNGSVFSKTKKMILMK